MSLDTIVQILTVAALDNQYETDKKILASYYLDAALVRMSSV